MAEKVPASTGVADLNSQLESEEDLPRGLPQFDLLPEEERVTLGASIAAISDMAGAEILESQSPRTGSPTVPIVIADAAHEVMNTPRDILSSSNNGLSSSDVGRELGRITRDFTNSLPREEARRLRDEADNFLRQNSCRISYRGMVTQLNDLFHQGFDLTALSRVYYFVARLLTSIWKEFGDSEKGVALASGVTKCFVAYMTKNLLQFATKLLVDAVSRGRSQFAGAITFALGLSSGVAISALVFVLATRIGRR